MSHDNPLEPQQELRFAVLLDGATLEAWQIQCLAQLTALPTVKHTLLLVIHGTGGDTVQAAGPSDAACRRLPLPETLRTVPVLEFSAQFPEAESPEVAARIRELHFILNFSRARLSSALIGMPRYGVWAFEFGDWDRLRGSPVGYWEVYFGHRLSCAMLVRLTADPEVVIPLRRGFLRTQEFSWRSNREQLLTRFTHWPRQLCLALLAGDDSSLNGGAQRATVPLTGPPTWLHALPLKLQFLRQVAVSAIPSLLQHDFWNVGIVRQPIAEFLDPTRPRPPVQWLPARRRGQFIADPFGVIRDGELTVFCEFLDYRDGTGRIAAIGKHGTGDLVVTNLGPHPAVHLSYPMLFEHDGRLLCIPETQSAREVALYALERFPDRWVKIATLVKDRAVVDATLFRHGGYWWLAAGSDPIETRLGADLNLWFAPALDGPWTAHPGNPVKTDVRSARPAGTPFAHDGALYRPAQDCSTAYGARVVINRVGTLTPQCFREEPVAFVEPDTQGPYSHGLHTLSAVGDLTLIDGKRLGFAPTEFGRALSGMLRKRWRRLRSD